MPAYVTIEPVDPEDISYPKFIVKWEKVNYLAQGHPWTVARVVKPNGDTNTMLHIEWERDPVSWYRTKRIKQIHTSLEVLNLIPTARIVE